ncbi:MAG: SurA N-terminal domain-containing protein [Deltaproteobacteria bacterium]|jgi:peptidyl-prolyl cis-trans isomerase SurA|nr:SurA N-terminal domain-containing protein [Deltaproteobacteria bacterium]
MDFPHYLGRRLNRVAALVCFLAVLTSLTMGLFGPALRPLAAATTVDRIVARVNNDVITLSELQAALKLISPQQKASFPERDLQMMVLENLIEKELISQIARNMGMMVGEQEIDNAIESIKQENNLTDAQFRSSLAAQGLSLPSLRNQIKFQILSDRVVRETVLRKIVVTDNEVTAFLNGEGAALVGGQGVTSLYDQVRLFFLPSKSPQLLKQLTALQNNVSAGTTPFSEAASTITSSLGGQEAESLTIGELHESLQQLALSLSPGMMSQPLDIGQNLLVIYVMPNEAPKAPRSTPSKASDFTQQERDTARRQIEQIKRQNKYTTWLQELKQKADIQITL